jgi:hypothetical protein
MNFEKEKVFTNSIFYGKKNRFVAWTSNQKDEPVIKGLDGLSICERNNDYFQKYILPR